MRRLTNLPTYQLTTLLPCHLTTLLTTSLPHYLTTLPPYYLTTLASYLVGAHEGVGLAGQESDLKRHVLAPVWLGVGVGVGLGMSSRLDVLTYDPRSGHLRLRRRLARAPEAVAGRPGGLTSPLEVPAARSHQACP